MIVLVVAVFVVFPVSSILVALFLVLLSYLLVFGKVVHDTATIFKALVLDILLMQQPPENIFLLKILGKLNIVDSLQ